MTFQNTIENLGMTYIPNPMSAQEQARVRRERAQRNVQEYMYQLRRIRRNNHN